MKDPVHSLLSFFYTTKLQQKFGEKKTGSSEHLSSTYTYAFHYFFASNFLSQNKTNEDSLK